MTTDNEREEAGWKCFHCGETFTDENCAREHFGTQQTSEPACKIQGGAIHGILEALRDAEEQLARYYQEDSDVCRSMHAMATKHAAQLRRCEEIGYERGLKAAKSESAAEIERLKAELAKYKDAEPVAWMYPWDVEKFMEHETYTTVFSVCVGCPEGTTVPLFTHPKENEL